ncbi:MAG: conjugal transfer protein TraR [Ignavibacteriaceae bacterium]
MAKRTTKKATSKTTKKSSSRAASGKKKITAAKSTKVKAVKKLSPVKKSVPEKKSAEVKKSAAAKKSAPKKISSAKTVKFAKKTDKKSTDTKQKQKRTMATKTKKKDDVKVKTAAVQTENTAEIRAKAMENIKGYSQKDLDHFRQIILEKRDEIIDQLQNLKDQMLDPTTGEYINENSPYSLHMAEQGTDAMEREKTFLYAQRENKFLGYLEDALKRIDAGTYGICIECIEEPQHLCETCPLVPKARLEAVPHSQLCLPIKQRQEKR